MAKPPATIARPELPELEPRELAGGGLEELELSEALVERAGRDPIAARRVRVGESELRGLTIGEGTVFELALHDARLVGCDLSNVHVRRGELRRVELTDSRLVGFAIGEGTLEDVRVAGGSAMLGSFAHTTLRRVVFERVNLRDVSFIESKLTSVGFEDCELAGADFRGARLKGCSIRGASLDGVIGVESLRGVTMPWSDLVASTHALAAALGIAIESD